MDTVNFSKALEALNQGKLVSRIGLGENSFLFKRNLEDLPDMVKDQLIGLDIKKVHCNALELVEIREEQISIRPYDVYEEDLFSNNWTILN